MNKKTKDFIKKCVGIATNEGLSLFDLEFNWRLRIGKRIYHQKFGAADVISKMKEAGVKEGSVVFIQSRWAEFYNFASTPSELIDAILELIGPHGTLAMACMPNIREGKLFNVKRTSTNAGLLAEVFRKYPGVKRSINLQHSVCAIGEKADYLVSEHHLSETPWDKKSPYYKLSELDAILFGFGLGKYWVGTIIHCVDSLLKDEAPYYTDLFFPVKTEHKYIDYDGIEKSYYSYDMPQTGPKIRIDSYFKSIRIAKKYLTGYYSRVSNLQISSYKAEEVVRVLTDLGRKGIDVYMMPSKRGYKFQN